MRAGVQPCEALSEGLHLQLAVAQERLVDRRDLQLAAGGRLDPLRDVHHLVGVEIEADDGVVALRLRRLLLDRKAVAVRVELRHAVALRVIDLVAEDRGLAVLRGGADRLLEERRQAGAVEDVVAQHQADAVVADELLADEERLREAVGRGLRGVLEMHAVVRPVAEQPLETGEVLRGADDQDVADPREHQHADRIIDHRLVEDREQLLADAFRDGVEPGSGAAGEDNAFHIIVMVE